MAGKTREIRSRIKAVANIQRITRTMQMIATARFQASQRRATAAQPYTRKIAELVGELSGLGGDEQGQSQSVSHPLLSSPSPAVGRELLLVITSNRGLCGGYNGNILRTAMKHLKSCKDIQIDVEVVGKKGENYFRFNGVEVSEYHEQFGDTPQFETVQALANHYMKQFEEGQYDVVHVLSMAFVSMSRQEATVLQLLPMADPTDLTDEVASPASASGSDYDFSPEPELLLNELLPMTVKTQLFQCFNESEVSEQIARMIAMKAATDNADQMRKDLSRVYNRARQTSITTELMEVISGAAALD